MREAGDLYVIQELDHEATERELRFLLQYRDSMLEIIARHHQSMASHEQLMALCDQSRLRQGAKLSQQDFHHDRLMTLHREVHVLHLAMETVNEQLLARCPHHDINEVHVCQLCHQKVVLLPPSPAKVVVPRRPSVSPDHLPDGQGRG